VSSNVVRSRAPVSAELIARGKALTESACTSCHGLSTVTAAGRNEDSWKYTVNEMIGLGAPLNDEEASAVVAYLTQAAPPK